MLGFQLLYGSGYRSGAAQCHPQQSGVLVHRPSRGPPPLTVLLVEAVFLLLVSMFSPWFCDFAQRWFQHGVPVGDFEVQGLDLILAQVRGMVPLCFKLKKE